MRPLGVAEDDLAGALDEVRLFARALTGPELTRLVDPDITRELRGLSGIAEVMKNGRLYDGMTLNEVYPRERPLGAQWWHALEPPAR